MTTVVAATRGAGRSKLIEALKERKNFKTSGALRGERRYSTITPMYGKLNKDERARLRADTDKGISYVVYSYETPIAWVTHDGEVYRVKQKFSVTTSKHMGAIYAL